MTEPTHSPTRLLSVADVAAQLGCSRGHVYGLLDAGHLERVEIRAKGVKSKTRVKAAELEDFIARNTSRAG